MLMHFGLNPSEKYLNNIYGFQTILRSGKEANMLILSRRLGETLIIRTPNGKQIEVTVLCIISQRTVFASASNCYHRWSRKWLG